tara:strand:- start:102 stop:497 length:396 start_codon:yes stop_codon:yes gene_type:complete
MEGISFLILLLVFVCGILFNVIWGQALGLGYGLVSFQNSITDALLMLTKNIQATYEIQQLKHLHYELLERDEKYIEFQKKIDEREITSLKNTVVRNYINSVPPRYNHLIKFNDWNSAMLYLDKSLKERSNG